ncbi:hypothetical protein SAMN05216386_0854 [Nitrosospira briensis]|uniref:Uncharacterized protein n=1 Tax=Nitrosospira briensis TaxID=35799 RepID=A0A1I4YSY0_9PROT|nr:hypothetical protein SAMN05216386_0854 [Nitrosospira briensis]
MKPTVHQEKVLDSYDDYRIGQVDSNLLIQGMMMHEFARCGASERVPRNLRAHPERLQAGVPPCSCGCLETTFVRLMEVHSAKIRRIKRSCSICTLFVKSKNRNILIEEAVGH